MEVEERYDLGKLVTFTPNERLPIHNWFRFKEGFSRDFVFSMFDQVGIERGSWVLDPFCGVGTTVLSAKERGINAVGVDAHPVFAFVSKAKTNEYRLDELKESSRELLSKRFVKPSLVRANPVLKRAFSKYALEDVVFFKSEIDKRGNPLEQDFFTLALMVAAMRVSYATKDGSVVRFFKRKHPPLKKVFKGTVKRFLRHLERVEFKPCTVTVKQGNTRKLNFLEDELFDAVITSPPYLNKLEYTRAFAVEEALLSKPATEEEKRTFMGLGLEKAEDTFPELSLPTIAKAYFHDLSSCLKEMYRVLRDGGRAILVIGQGVFPDRIVESDVLAARLAERIGFNIKKRLVVNRRVATKERTIKIGVALESVLFMAK